MKTSSIICSLLLSTLTVPAAAAEPTLSSEPEKLVEEVSPQFIGPDADRKTMLVHFVRFGADFEWTIVIKEGAFAGYIEKYGFRGLTVDELKTLQLVIKDLPTYSYLRKRNVIALGDKIPTFIPLFTEMPFNCIDRDGKISKCPFNQVEWFAGGQAVFPVVRINRP